MCCYSPYLGLIATSNMLAPDVLICLCKELFHAKMGLDAILRRLQ